MYEATTAKRRGDKECLYKRTVRAKPLGKVRSVISIQYSDTPLVVTIDQDRVTRLVSVLILGFPSRNVI